MNVSAKQKQSHRYRKQTSGYHMGERSGEGQFRGREFRDTNYYIKQISDKDVAQGITVITLQ